MTQDSHLHDFSHYCLKWHSTQAAVRCLKRELANSDGSTDGKVQAARNALLALKLRGALKRAWHGNPTDKLESVGKAIEEFAEKNNVSSNRIKSMCRAIGFCLGDGAVYCDRLSKVLKNNKKKMVHREEAKSSCAKKCLVVCC